MSRDHLVSNNPSAGLGNDNIYCASITGPTGSFQYASIQYLNGGTGIFQYIHGTTASFDNLTPSSVPWANVPSNIVPSATDTYDLGLTGGPRWNQVNAKTIYV